MLRIRSLLPVVPLLALASCFAEAELDSQAQDLLQGCPLWGCGTNSPEMESNYLYRFHDLDPAGGWNSGGVRIKTMRKGTATLEPHVVGDQLVAINAASG